MTGTAPHRRNPGNSPEQGDPAGPAARQPLAAGLLDTGEGHHVSWQTWGTPDGVPAVYLHGGPGSGTWPGAWQAFDPARNLIVLYDQRGCGASTPHAADPGTTLATNTTHHLIADLERLRRHLGISRWILHGVSWGSTLALAYAQQHPQRAAGIVLRDVTVTRRSDTDWLYHGVRRYFPAEWDAFQRTIAALDPALHAGGTPATTPGCELVAACARLASDPDPAVREQVTTAWCTWEDAVLSLEPGVTSGSYSTRPPRARLALVRLAAHYFAHGAWLEEGQLLRDAHLLAGIPGILIHGRLDLGGPLSVAWELHRAWPGSELTVINDAGHLGNQAMHAAVRSGLEALTARASTNHR